MGNSARVLMLAPFLLALVTQSSAALQDATKPSSPPNAQDPKTDDPVAELATLQAGGELRRFRVDNPDLESVFLNLTGRQLRD